MVTLIWALAALAFVSETMADTTRVMSGGVSGVWTRDHSPYIIEGDVVIAKGASLRIEPGVKVEFSGPFSMTVYGSLVVGKRTGRLKERTKINRLTTIFTADTIINPTGWRGLRFKDADDCVLANCEFSNGRAFGEGEAGMGGAILCVRTKLALANCSLSNNQAENAGGGLAVIGGSVALANSEVNHNFAGVQGGGIFADQGAEIALANGNISENFSGGIACVNKSELALANGNILANSGYGILADESEISIVNATIEGNTLGGIVLRNRSEGSLVNCSLRGHNAFEREEDCEVAKINVSIRD